MTDPSDRLGTIRRVSLPALALAAFAAAWLPAGAQDEPAGSPPPVRARYSFRTPKQFGIEVKDARDRWQRLTYSALGTTNVTLLKVGQETAVFGHNEGAARDAQWQTERELSADGKAKRALGTTSAWTWNGLKTIQTLEIVRGAGAAAFDVCKVTYELENLGSRRLEVGVRVLLDTLVGENDAPAFQPLPEGSLILSQAAFEPKTMPAALKLLEVANPRSQGLVAYLSLKLDKPIQAPDRLLVTRLPDKGDQWDVPLQNMRDDACVVLYWTETALEPGPSNRRVLGYAYGLSPYRGPNPAATLQPSESKNK